MKTWAFHSQVFFLSHKLKLHQELLAAAAPAVIDRTIYEDARSFAREPSASSAISRGATGLVRALRPGADRPHRHDEADYVEDLVDLIALEGTLDQALL